MRGSVVTDKTRAEERLDLLLQVAPVILVVTDTRLRLQWAAGAGVPPAADVARAAA
ncbi:hypothetical protein [Amycolatopsis sp. NPDC004378]